jgi:protein-S-isoprenylcysteine O-methyltransferase Ste14
MSVWRHALAIVLLPGTVTVAVPALLLATNDWELDPVRLALAVPLAGGGFALWLWTVLLFARVGRGTLAPWDPTERLVVQGPYAHARNPMITGVLAILIAEALAFGSLALLAWAGVFAAVNHVFFLVYEEPAVERRFGREYRRYKQNVPRWIPRRAPWRCPGQDSNLRPAA